MLHPNHIKGKRTTGWAMCGDVASNFEVGWRAPTTGTVIMGATRAQQYSTGELLPPDAPPWCADSMPVRAWRWCGACNPLLVLTHALPGALLLLLYCCHCCHCCHCCLLFSRHLLDREDDHIGRWRSWWRRLPRRDCVPDPVPDRGAPTCDRHLRRQPLHRHRCLGHLRHRQVGLLVVGVL